MSQRIPRLELKDLRTDLAQYLEPRVKRLGYLGELFKCVGHAPGVLLNFMQFTDALKEALPDRLTEVGALTVAGLMENDYERHQHERLSIKLGFGAEWIAEVNELQPQQAKLMSETERIAQRYAIAAIKTRGREVENEFEALVSALSASEAMAFVLLVGRYVAHALAVNTLKLKPPVPSIFASEQAG